MDQIEQKLGYATPVKIVDEGKLGGGCYVMMDDQQLFYFQEHERPMANSVAKRLYEAFEMGFGNGLYIGVTDPEKAGDLLYNRNIKLD